MARIKVSELKMNGEHGKIYDKIDSLQLNLLEKMDEIKTETFQIKTDIAVIKNSFNSLPCNSHETKLNEIEKRMYLGIGALTILLILFEIGLLKI